MKAALLVSHGSHSKKTKGEVASLTAELREQNKGILLEYAFLEIESPSIPEGIDLCLRKGATEILVLLNFLNSGKHVDEDIPRIVKEEAKKYPQVYFHITMPVGQHPGIKKLFQDLINK
jgi:sirohydrochlorin ferrochelatase